MKKLYTFDDNDFPILKNFPTIEEELKLIKKIRVKIKREVYEILKDLYKI